MRSVVATAFAAGLLAAQEAPTKSQSQSARSPLEITPPTAEWYDEALLDKAVAALVKRAEHHSGLQFDRLPRVRIANSQSWLAVVKRIQPKARDHKLAATLLLGLYQPGDGVLLSPVAGTALLEFERDPERRRMAFGRTVLVHELVHALQEQYFGLVTRRLAAKEFARKWVLKAMSEGHAYHVEACFAGADLQLADHARRMDRMHLRNRRNHYVQGRRFVANFLAMHGREKLHAALRHGPPTLAEFGRIANRKISAKSDCSK
ncbi:MAG: hypothetical protein NXI31_18240 [bacterium]|nr:hypothetical protein [bacterium]